MKINLTSTEVMLYGIAISNIFGWLSVFYFSITEILAVWSGLGISLALVGSRYRVLRIAKAWQIWVPITIIGISLNYATYKQGILVQYGFTYIWLIAIGIGYIFLSVYNRSDKRLGKYNRIHFAISGIISIALFIYIVVEKPEMSIRISSGLLVSVIPSIIVSIIYRYSEMKV